MRSSNRIGGTELRVPVWLRVVVVVAWSLLFWVVASIWVDWSRWWADDCEELQLCRDVGTVTEASGTTRCCVFKHPVVMANALNVTRSFYRKCGRSNISYMHGESNVLSKGWKLLQWRVSSTKSSRCIRSILSPACLCQLHISTWVHLLLLFLFPVHSNSWTQTDNIHIYAALPPSFIVSLLISWNSDFYITVT